MIRALVDANILISHLLKPTADSPPNRIVRAAIAQDFEMVMIEATLAELHDSIRTKPYLNQRITTKSAAHLESSLRLVATIVPEALNHVPRLTRDPGDDYLLAHSVLLDIGYLVTGDQDLLVLDVFESVRIVSPATFAALLDEAG